MSDRPGLDAQARAAIVAHMNDDHADAVLLYARRFGAAPDAARATLIDIDRSAMTLRVDTPAGGRTVIVALDEPIASPGHARTVLVRMAKAARAADAAG